MKRFLQGAALLALLASPLSQAGVVMGGTRVVYPQGQKEVSFSVTNREKKTPYLIQSWVDKSAANAAPPFIVTPPLFRLDPEQKNVLRISYTGAPLPTDRESVFWLNVKNIAPSNPDGSNQLQVNVKSRFKIFFRPRGLAGDPSEAYRSVTFTCSGNRLTAHNPTPYFVSFYQVKSGSRAVDEPGMVSPQGERQWPVTCGGAISWQAINDFGGITPAAVQQ